MKLLKKTVLGAILICIMTMGALLSNTDNKDFNFSLNELINTANADCENSNGGYPSTPCAQIWCSSTYTYGGCGSGNGNVCYTRKSC